MDCLTSRLRIIFATSLGKQQPRKEWTGKPLTLVLRVSLNVTDFIGGAGGGPMWDYDDVYFAA